MQGTKLVVENDQEDLVYEIFNTPGAYGTNDGVHWYCCTPNGLMGNLSKHQVVEHEDGTITVSPSILVTMGNDANAVSWHGYLEHGVWREC